MPKNLSRLNYKSYFKGFTLIRTLLRKNLVNVQQGFTLIELLVVVMTMALLFGVGMARYRDFSKRREVERAGTKIRNSLKLTQEYALSGRKPDNVRCNFPRALDGYDFVRVNATTYRVNTVCTGGTVTGSNDTLDVSGVTFTMVRRGTNCTGSTTNVTSFRFKPLGSGTDITRGSCIEIRLSQTGTSNTYTITIDSSGAIK